MTRRRPDGDPDRDLRDRGPDAHRGGLRGRRDLARDRPPDAPPAAVRRGQPKCTTGAAGGGHPGALPGRRPDRRDVRGLPGRGLHRRHAHQRDDDPAAAAPRQHRGAGRPPRGDPPAGPVHDRLRRARAQVAGPRPHRGRGPPLRRPDRVPDEPPGTHRVAPDHGHQCRHPPARGGPDEPPGDDHRRAQVDRGAWRPAGHPGGRGRADDQRGHRARARAASTRSWSRAST